MKAQPSGGYFEAAGHFDRLVETIAEGIFIVATDGTILLTNAAGERILGRKRSDIIGRQYNDPVWAMTTTDGRTFPDEEHPCRKALEAGENVYGIVLEIARPDKTRLTLSFNAAPLRDTSGKEIGTVETFTDVTGRRREEEVLKDSEERFRSLTGSVHDAVIGCVEAGTIVDYWNRGAERIFGYTSNEMVGRPLATVIPKDLREKHKQGVDHLLATGKGTYIGGVAEFRGLRKNGSEFPMEISLGLWTRKGEVLFTAVIRDISERKMAEDELRESEKRFRGVFESAAIAIGITDLEGHIYETNDMAQQLFGYTDDELVKMQINELTYAPDWPKEIILLNELVLGKRDYYRLDKRIIAKGGALHWVTLTVSLVRDSRGRPQYFVEMLENIDDWKKVEEELELKTNLLDSVIDSIFIVSLDGNLLYVNKAAYEDRGYTRDELMAMSIKELDDPEYAVFVDSRIRQILEEGSLIFESAHIKKNGSVMPVEIHASVMEFRGQRVITSVLRDITVRKRLEREIERSHTMSRALNEINEAMYLTIGFNEIMAKVIARAMSAIRADVSAVLMMIDGGWSIEYAAGAPENLVGRRYTNEEARVATLTAESKKVISIDDALTDERIDRTAVTSFGIRSMLSVPLIIKGKAFGVLVFGRLTKSEAFEDVDIDFATKAAASVSLAIENANLYAAERHIADTLQEALLIMPDEIPGVEFAHFYRSATEAAQVGGDFFDLFELEHGRIGILIGDISGKGLEAATLTSLIKDSVRAYAHVESSPASIIAKTNHLIVESMVKATFATVFFGILDSASGLFVYTNAGHPVPVVRRSDAEIAILGEMSPVLGAFDGVVFGEGEEILRQGDVVVLYTDGITEARCNEEFFGEERLKKVIEEGPVDPEEMTAHIYRSVMKFSGGQLSDDLALLVVVV